MYPVDTFHSGVKKGKSPSAQRKDLIGKLNSYKQEVASKMVDASNNLKKRKEGVDL